MDASAPVRKYDTQLTEHFLPQDGRRVLFANYKRIALWAGRKTHDVSSDRLACKPQKELKEEAPPFSPGRTAHFLCVSVLKKRV